MNSAKFSRSCVVLVRGCRIAMAAAALVTWATLGSGPRVRADDSCDTSEQVACISVSDESSQPANSPQTANSGSSVAGSASAGTAAAAVPVPIPGGCTVAPCYLQPPCPIPLPASNSAGIAAGGPEASAAVPVLPAPIVPAPVFCSPYFFIFKTINLGNAADVRALRTLSSDGLRQYWRGDALRTIQDQVRALRDNGLMGNARLLSIQVQSRSFDSFSQTARVRTLEHWQLDERSLDDGSLVLSQDQWVRNDYSLSLLSDGWFITGDTTAVLSGPFIPLG
jgi:hypothetical protein